MNKEEVGKKLEDLRIQHGYTQKGLATRFGITTKTIRNYESGRNAPCIEILEMYHTEFRVSYDEILCKKREFASPIYEEIRKLSPSKQDALYRFIKQYR